MEAFSRPHVADGAVAGAVLVATLLGRAGGDHLHDGVAVLLAAAAAAPLLLRSRLPFTVLAVSTVAAEVYMARYRGDNGILALSAPLVALYTVAEHSDRRRSLVLGGVVVLSIGAFHTFYAPSRVLGPENLTLVALGALAVAAGTAARHRRRYLAESEHGRELDAQRRVAEERLRIARDLHDSVGHQLALINVQAGVAAHLLTDPVPEVREALRHVRDGSKAALEELRDSVGLLRQPGEPAAPVEPTLGLAGLDDLLASFRRSGLRVDVHRQGAPPALSRPVDLTAYRVIQEALTNACKHAAGQPVQITMCFRRDELQLTVENDGPRAVPAAGHGIAGMRERVGAVGGSLRAGPRPSGGFLVAATLPGGVAT
ncbi:sensor histidine kinase [Paractinoplanes brasiliensis]|uniref:histidine kinase n=1 Tax=Paractinoplanes brasiliensis TaxID=52695 RepID=A0A4R6K1A0_9ACTN|nr:histidine kinase [Actinoplanes brasiliensis]TDO41871.1 signal transduction histidine kinase [Actinoplanes brasiliensis]GID29849.1 two-component sensor histidine kinase [Actinoplanes brasiliensis]